MLDVNSSRNGPDPARAERFCLLHGSSGNGTIVTLDWRGRRGSASGWRAAAEWGRSSGWRAAAEWDGGCGVGECGGGGRGRSAGGSSRNPSSAKKKI